MFAASGALLIPLDNPGVPGGEIRTGGGFRPAVPGSDGGAHGFRKDPFRKGIEDLILPGDMLAEQCRVGKGVFGDELSPGPLRRQQP